MGVKLYPPTVAGTLPAFYGTTLVVPFLMNPTVAEREISAFSLRIKTIATDQVLSIITVPITACDFDKPELTIDLKNEKVLNRLTVGVSYKIQIAYIDQFSVVGYYSSLSIIKYTAIPTIKIEDLNAWSINNHVTSYVGTFVSSDTSEKVVNYRFNFFDSNHKLIETSGWKLHDSYTDSENGIAADTYVVKYELVKDLTYYIQYEILTNNNISLTTPYYKIVLLEQPDMPAAPVINLSLDEENAIVNISFVGNINLIGKFILRRGCSKDSFYSYATIADFELKNNCFNNVAFKDFTIEQGYYYKYKLQQYNDSGLYSAPIESEEIFVNFDDMFLYDGEKQLRILYNPKVSSFKKTIQESKKDTIGGKYPVFFRNGFVGYHEFPISGLISYLMDPDELFFNKSQYGYNNWIDRADLSDENMALERNFRLEVLEWLNDGKVKLFKSPAEGNYLVRIMNVSLSPNDTTSRMLNTFTANAYGCGDYDIEDLSRNNLLMAPNIIQEEEFSSPVIISIGQEIENLEAEIANYTTKDKAIWLYKNGLITADDWNTISDEEIEAMFNPNDAIAQRMKDFDLLHGGTCNYINIQDCRPGTIVLYNNGQEIMIGSTGNYCSYFNPPISNLSIANLSYSELKNLNMIIEGNSNLNIPTDDSFNNITVQQVLDLPCLEFIGPVNNILPFIQNYKTTILELFQITFEKIETEENDKDYSVVLDDQTFDINKTGYLKVRNIEVPHERISIGDGVIARLTLRQQIKTYRKEKELTKEYEDYLVALGNYIGSHYGLGLADNSEYDVYYYFNGFSFVRFDKNEYIKYQDKKTIYVNKEIEYSDELLSDLQNKQNLFFDLLKQGA